MLQVLSDAENDLKVKEVAERINKSRQTVSKHKSELVRAGIIEQKDSGQSTTLKLGDDLKASIILGSTEDSEVIENTSLDNASIKKEADPDNRDMYRILAYRSQGVEGVFNEEIELKEDKYSVSELLGKILRTFEEETEQKLEKQARELYKETLEKYIREDSYKIREKLKIESNLNNIAKCLVKGAEIRIDRLNPSINSHPIETDGQPRPEYLFLLFQPFLIRYLGGNPDKARKILDENLFDRVDRFKSVTGDLDEVEKHLHVLRSDELEMLQEVQRKLEERREGELMLTMTRDLGILPQAYGEIEIKDPKIPNPPE